MPGRYEIVDEPVETLEVVDDEVYHPDLTVRDTPSASFRSLEPILAGPITLKTIFYDPRWSNNKRRCCVCFVGIASLVCFSLMISLFVGLGQVISYINESERLRQTGLYMVPDLEQSDVGLFLYNVDKKFAPLHKKYIDEIEGYLKKYREQGPEFQNCSANERAEKGKACRFNLDWLGTECTQEKNYGYSDGNPCILFAFRNVKNWYPNISETAVKNAAFLAQSWKRDNQQIDQYHLPLTCGTSYSTGLKVSENEVTFKYYPEAGFNLTFLNSNGANNEQQLPPLVFVQFIRPPYKLNPQINVKCQISAPNLDEFKGIKIMDFEFDDSDDIQGTALDRP